MRLEYNILWIDNDLQSYIDNGSVASIEDFLWDRGFEPNIEKVFDEANLDEYILKHDYDLIISDYNLENTTGDLIIEDIRRTRQLDTDILFYTAQASYKNNPNVKDRLAFIDRLTFQVGRESLLEKIERVIELTLKKLLELNATRGLITAATSDLDVEIEELVHLLIEKNKIEEPVLKKFVEEKVVLPQKKRLDNFWDQYRGFSNYFEKMDALRKWELLRELLKEMKGDKEVKLFLEINRDYQNDVIGIRNKFAHAKAVKFEGKLILKGQFGQEPFQFDTDSCIQVRKDLIKHKRSFIKLKKVLSKALSS